MTLHQLLVTALLCLAIMNCAAESRVADGVPCEPTVTDEFCSNGGKTIVHYSGEFQTGECVPLQPKTTQQRPCADCHEGDQGVQCSPTN